MDQLAIHDLSGDTVRLFPHHNGIVITVDCHPEEGAEFPLLRASQVTQLRDYLTAWLEEQGRKDNG